MVLLEEAKLQTERIIFHWEPYYSFSSEFLFRRIDDFLSPPGSVKLDLDNGVLYAHGSAFHAWIIEARKKVNIIPGITQYNEDNLVDIDLKLNTPETITLELENGVLHAYGGASHRWIVDSRDLAETLPGISHFADDHIVDMDLNEMGMIKQKIEVQSFPFSRGSSEITEGQEAGLEALAWDIRRIFELAEVLEKDIHIQIVGYADRTGTDEVNLKVSRERAESVLAFLASKGLNEDEFTTIGLGARESPLNIKTPRGRESDRCVIFRVVSRDNPH
jgi:OOP family OmpA-OmpF porin